MFPFSVFKILSNFYSISHYFGKNMSRKIPDRWLDYKAVGDIIEGTRFIAFKVPLKNTLCRSLSSTERFTPSMLLEKCPQLGLIIDLTNTMRYYRGEEFVSRGVQYQKLLCPGHEIPGINLVRKFFRVVDAYLKDNPDSSNLIGVHCTHGLNRTSYFVLSYMILRMGMIIDDAVKAFEIARGHPIERLNYISHLPSLVTKIDQFDAESIAADETLETFAEPSDNRNDRKRDRSRISAEPEDTVKRARRESFRSNVVQDRMFDVGRTGRRYYHGSRGSNEYVPRGVEPQYDSRRFETRKAWNSDSYSYSRYERSERDSRYYDRANSRFDYNVNKPARYGVMDSLYNDNTSRGYSNRYNQHSQRDYNYRTERMISRVPSYHNGRANDSRPPQNHPDRVRDTQQYSWKAPSLSNHSRESSVISTSFKNLENGRFKNMECEQQKS